MAKDTWTMIDDRLKSFKSLYDRMDTSKDLLYMEDFKLKDWEGKTLSKVINVTGNKGASYAVRVIASLMPQKWQTVVEGEISKREAHTIEEFLDANFDQTDIYLAEKYGIPDLHSWLCNHVCIRGAIGIEWMSWIENDEYKIHCNPVDMRWTPYVLNKWVAPITFRKKDDLEQELEDYAKRAEVGLGEYTKPEFKTGTEDVEIRDYWNIEKNELWIEKQLVFSQPNKLGMLPFVIVFPPSGFMLRDKGYLEHEGEDIFYLIRKLDKEMNRTLSVEQTFAFRQLYPAFERETKNLDGKPAKPVPKTGEVGKVAEGELPHPIELGDMNRASQIARQDLQKMIDEGAPLQPRAYTQPPSAVEVATEVELLNQLQHSRILALQMFRAQLSRMMIDQFQLNCEGQASKLNIGKLGRRKQFSVAQLKDPEKYSINCQLMSRHKKLEIVNEARAIAMWGKAPLRYILRDILLVEDPDGWLRELELEEARRADPALALFEMGVRYAEEAEDMEDESEAELKRIESKMLIERGKSIVKQRMAPAPLPEEARVPQVEKQKGSSQALMPLLGSQGGVAKATTPEEVSLG